MARQSERIVKVEVFENSGTTYDDGWKVGPVYREDEQIQNLKDHKNSKFLPHDHRNMNALGSAHSKITNSGFKTAGPNGSKDTGLVMQAHNSSAGCYQAPRQGETCSLPCQELCDQSMMAMLSTLSVNLPPATGSSSHQGQLINLNAEDEKTGSHHRNSYKEAMLQGIPNGISHDDYNHTPAAAGGHAGGGRDFHQIQPRVVVTETVHPSKPSFVPPPMDKGMGYELLQEEADDDVFDEKHHNKSPSISVYPKLKRGFSNVVENEGLVCEARHRVKADIQTDSHTNMYVQTFVLPDLTAYDAAFRSFLERELVETSTLMSLEHAGRLNWWADVRLCQRLVPLATSGDGNCLLHAASLAMWGIHDRQLILRKELHETLTKASYKDALYRRWRYQQTVMNKQSGLVFSEAEWEEEWTNILRLASPLPRGANSTMGASKGVSPGKRRYEEPVVYESLEEFHVFVLAHVLQRPIIVVADAFLKNSCGEALAPIPFPGIYLPLEVHTSYMSPLLLTYDAAHFSALTPMEQSPASSPFLPAAIPLLDPELKLLPLHFYIEPGPSVNWSQDLNLEWNANDKITLLHKFLHLEWLPICLDTYGDDDKGSSGSQESDEAGNVFRDLSKRKNDGNKTQQFQAVAKQFGSLGKSMGRRLKQLGKAAKGEKYFRLGVDNELAQDQRATTNNENHGSGYEYVLVAKLSEKRGKQQQEMIQNYLHNARERFETDMDLKRRCGAECKRKLSSSTPTGTEATSCSTYTSGESGEAQPNACCSRCYAPPDHTLSIRNSNIYNTFPGRSKQPGAYNKIPEEIFVYGKSKFYTTSNENINTRPPSAAISLNKQQTTNSGQNSSSSFSSLSPDYNSHSSQSSVACRLPPVTAPKADLKQHAAAESRQMCRSSGCDFYGSLGSEGFCSKCYQRVHADSLQDITQGITKF